MNEVTDGLEDNRDEDRDDSYFIDTADDLAWLDDDFDWSVVEAECEQLENDGFVKVPDWMPVPHPDYKWEFPYNIFAYMKPAPTFWHRMKYRPVFTIPTPWWLRNLGWKILSSINKNWTPF